MINDRVLKSSDIMLLGDILVTENGSQIPVIGYSGQVVSDAVNAYTNFIECRRPRKVEESPGTVPAVAAANNRSDEIAWLEGTLKDCDGYFSSSDDYVFIKTRINERIAQLRAMR